jgi:membrane-associated phospholipid phosphatase
VIAVAVMVAVAVVAGAAAHVAVARAGARPAPLTRSATLRPAGGVDAMFAATVLAAGALTVAILHSMVRADWGLARFDRTAAEWSARQATERSVDLLELVTSFGATLTIVVVALAAAVFEQRRIPGGSAAAFVAAVVVGQWLLTNTTKSMVDRARPDIDPLSSFSGASFPSGHAAASAALFLAVALLAGRGRSRAARSLLVGVGVGLAVAVSASRVLLGVHWLTDAVAGTALGWAWCGACAAAFGARRLGCPAPVTS